MKLVVWLEKNKRFMIGFLATITITFTLLISQKILFYRNKTSILSSIQQFMDNKEINNELLLVVSIDICIKIMIGLSVVYFILVVLKFIFSVLKSKLGRVDRI